MSRTYRRGELVNLRPPRHGTGHEQRGFRPAVVLQTDDAAWLSTTIVAPTSTSAQSASFRPEIQLRGRSTKVLLDQITAVDRGRLGRSSGLLPAADLQNVERALRAILSLF